MSAPASLVLFLAASCSPGARQALPWELRAEGWRTDPAWHDGQAEVCTYDATRTIYGVGRSFVASAYTNTELADEGTRTKSETEEGVPVFKHHWSERVPTERYDYDFSTVSVARSADLAPFQLTAATQEDCGASFKQVWRDGQRLTWLESVYFPGAGLRQGELDGDGAHFEDALTLVLRDFPFERSRAGDAHGLSLVPSQKSTRRVPFEPLERSVRYGGEEELELPIGALRAHRLTLEDPSGATLATYWFAAQGGAPWLHVLVRYEGPDGVTYRLRSLERDAYWEH